MKARIILLIAITAITTLSFTFASFTAKSEKTTSATKTYPVKGTATEPVGGFIAEDEI